MSDMGDSTEVGVGTPAPSAPPTTSEAPTTAAPKGFGGARMGAPPPPPVAPRMPPAGSVPPAWGTPSVGGQGWAGSVGNRQSPKLRAGVTQLDIIAAWVALVVCVPLGFFLFLPLIFIAAGITLPIIRGGINGALTARLMLGALFAIVVLIFLAYAALFASL